MLISSSYHTLYLWSEWFVQPRRGFLPSQVWIWIWRSCWIFWTVFRVFWTTLNFGQILDFDLIFAQKFRSLEAALEGTKIEEKHWLWLLSIDCNFHCYVDHLLLTCIDFLELSLRGVCDTWRKVDLVVGEVGLANSRLCWLGHLVDCCNKHLSIYLLDKKNYKFWYIIWLVFCWSIFMFY